MRERESLIRDSEKKVGGMGRIFSWMPGRKMMIREKKKKWERLDGRQPKLHNKENAPN